MTEIYHSSAVKAYYKRAFLLTKFGEYFSTGAVNSKVHADYFINEERFYNEQKTFSCVRFYANCCIVMSDPRHHCRRVVYFHDGKLVLIKLSILLFCHHSGYLL